MKILILDEDKNHSNNLQYSLNQDDIDVQISSDPKDEISKLKCGKYDLVIMESVFKNINGLTLIQSIRKETDIPIIVVSKVNDDIQKILAFDYGADDYLTKPYNIVELKARIKAIMRRLKASYRDSDEIEINFDDYIIKPVGRVLVKGEHVVSLTGKEFDLLYVLCSNPGEIFSREELMTKVWGYEYFGDARSIDVHIRRIREKIEPDPKEPKYLKTKWGQGYYFQE